LKGKHPLKISSLDSVIVRSGELYQRVTKDKILCYEFVTRYTMSDNEKKILKANGLKEKTFPNIEDELNDC